MIIAPLALAIPAAHGQPFMNADKMFAKLDANSDGKLDKAEVTKMMEMRAARSGESTDPAKVDEFMKRADTNADGGVDKAELETARKAKAAASN